MSMSRRRKSARSEPYAIRWHSYSDITTPSADIMSSPDPLNDNAIEAVIMPSSVNRAARSVTRSIRSDHFTSRESSPRKQTFELEVGDNEAPQRLYVTVETDGAPASAGANGTRRRLFQSPSPMPMIRRRERAITTTVPLRDTIEEDAVDPNATPRRRGRPRKSNGTPIPSAGTKRRAGTPIKRTPRRPRMTATTIRDEEPTPQPTPGSKRRGRPPKNRDTELLSEPGMDSSRGIISIKRGRRRQALSPQKSLEVTNEEPELPMNFDAESQGENEVTLVTLPSETNASEGPALAPAEPASEGESDIWMATIDDGPTPRARTTTQTGLAPSSPEPEADRMQEDFGFFPSAASDISSVDEKQSDFGPTGGDTIAQGEDFSMIFMDSLPTLRSSVQVPVEADFGEETSLIINNTLESLRESLRKSQRRDEQGEGRETTGAAPPEPRASTNFRFFDSEPIEPEPSQPEPSYPESIDVDPVGIGHAEPEHLEPEYAEPEHIESEHSETNQAEVEHVEPETSKPELAQFEASVSEYIESRHVAPVVTDHAEIERIELEEAQSDNIEPEHEESEHPESEQNGHEDMETEQTEIDQSYPGEPDLIEPEHIEIDQAEPEHVESNNVQPENVEPDPTEAGRIGNEGIQSELGQFEPNEPVHIEPHSESPSIENEPITSKPTQSDVFEVQPIIRPPFPLSPNRNLSPRWVRSPRRGTGSPLRHQLLKFKARQTDDSPPRVSEDDRSIPALSSPKQRNTPRRFNEGDSNLYDDSFSEIPQDVLEAATPHRPRTTRKEEVAEAEPEEDQDMADNQPPQQTENHEIPADDADATALSQTEGGRLPTPDDTPPQIDAEPDEYEKSTQESQASAGAAPQRSSSPVIPHENRSMVVPEIVEEMVEDDAEEAPEILHPHRESTLLGTHAVRPEVTPVNQMTSPLQDPQSLAPETLQEKISRPLLSPIVRAGRALQSVTSDPPSPEPREQQLRSPFRSSVTRELGPPTRETPSNIRMSISPRRSLAFSMANQPQPVNQVYDDPFGSDPRHTGQISFMEALERSSGKSVPQATNESLIDSPASSMRISPSHEVEMSWIADEGPISPNLRGDVPLNELSQHVTEQPVSLASHATSDGDNMAIDVDDLAQAHDDETDIWELEAMRATPRTTRQQPFGNRRRGLPSPWTKQAMEKPLRDEPTISREEEQDDIHAAQESVSDADRTEEAVPEEAQMEEYSLLTQQEPGKDKNKDQAPKSATKASRFDLASFFSSPAVIPGMLTDKLLPAKTKSVFGARPSEPEPEMVGAAPVLPTSSMFPQVAHKELQPRPDSHKDLFSPIRAKEKGPAEEEHSSSSEDISEPELPSIVQKKNFTPGPNQPNESFKSSTRSGVPTPPRMQLSHADIQRWQQEASAASEDSPEVHRPILRPLPPKNASPIKSSLRSPLKPHTPGRVVEFTSNVLSPIEQAKVRQMRRLSNSAASQASNVPQRQPPRMTDKENHRAPDVSVSDALSQAKAPTHEPLSQTVWTRQHWLFMDELLQLRKAGPYDVNYQRRTKKFLGKTVKSHGEAMRLDRWHLDCVDAFKAEVGGWDESILVKRLFALIMGEERRSRGINDSPARVMFH